MSSIQNPSLAAGTSNQFGALSDAQVAGYLKKQSVTASRTLNAGLTIQTKDGDLVTLTSSSFAQLDAFRYDRSGMVQTEDGTILTSLNQREVTLSTGESFSFSVVGDLSDAELEDIEDIVKGIDGIIAEMADGDMDEAVGKAMEMGSYDTVSMYAADISMEKSVKTTTETQAQIAAVPENTELLPDEDAQVKSQIEPYPENHAPKKQKKNSIKDINQFVERMTEQLDKHTDKQLARSQKAVDKLFAHHMRKEKENRGLETSAFNAIDHVAKKIGDYLDKITQNLFDTELSSF